MTGSDWLPALIEMQAAAHVWDDYCELVYVAFCEDFIARRPAYLGQVVQCRRDPITQSKEAGFWHCVSTGKTEEERIPDPRRCERIRWVRAVIENCLDVRIKRWSNDKRGDMRRYIWFNEEFLVVLGQRKGYLQLITAFCTYEDHTRRKLRREYHESHKD